VAQEKELAESEQGGEAHGSGAGTLGKAGAASAAHHDEAGALGKAEEGKPEAPEHATAAGGKPEGEHSGAKSSEAKAGEEESKSEGSGAESHSPEDAAKHSPGGASSHEAVDKNSDEYLLNALKDAGVEPPGGKAPRDEKLPGAVKEAPRAATKARSGTYVIQVGSHPTQGEAESQVRALRASKVHAEILPAFKDKQGEWHRVVIAGFKTKREAEKEASGLKGKGSIVSYFVWRLP
jgi:cell division protein FtsN